jgi:membrane protein YdbS with pleckstrin-like domain
MIRPSHFLDDPLGHVLNQAGHCFIGAGVMALLPLSLWSVLGLAVAYFVVIEVPQIRSNNTRRVRWDSAEDALHVTMGALLVVTTDYVAGLAWLAILGFGAWKRT